MGEGERRRKRGTFPATAVHYEEGGRVGGEKALLAEKANEGEKGKHDH